MRSCAINLGYSYVHCGNGNNCTRLLQFVCAGYLAGSENSCIYYTLIICVKSCARVKDNTVGMCVMILNIINEHGQGRECSGLIVTGDYSKCLDFEIARFPIIFRRASIIQHWYIRTLLYIHMYKAVEKISILHRKHCNIIVL